MQNPILVEMRRGALIESFHRGAIAIADERGQAVFTLGEVDHPVFPRSAVKALQALPLIESGAADAFSLTAAHLALACASHNGEEAQITAVRDMLAHADLTEEFLECGPQQPRQREDQIALWKRGEKPARIHNSCSGKHAGFLCVAKQYGFDLKGYVQSSHPVQEHVRQALEEMTGISHEMSHMGRDGCSIPTYAVPLAALAGAFARFGTGVNLPKERAKAAKTLRKACAAVPFMVAGTDRFCTSIMRIFGERVFVKVGAEGVFCAAFPELGLGVALKIEDGASRAAETAMAAIIANYIEMDEDEYTAMTPFLAPPLRNFNGEPTGSLVSAIAFA